MNRICRLLGGCLVLLLATSLAACAEREPEDITRADTLTARAAPIQGDSTAPSIYALIAENDSLTRFRIAIDSAGLDQTLAGPGPFTVFAPISSAFADVTDSESLLTPERRDDLRGLLLHHITNGAMRTQDLLAGATLRTLEGSDLSVDGSEDSLRVGGGRVIEPEIRAENGVIHIIDRVLEPGDTGAGA